MSKKKRPPNPIPDNWRQRTEERVQVQKLPTRIKDDMLRLLRKDDVGKAAALLWPKIPKEYGVDLLAAIIWHAIYILTVPIENDPVMTCTSAAWRKIAEPEGPRNPNSDYLLLADYAPKYKPKDMAMPAALNRLRMLFQTTIGKPLNSVVANFMRAAFGATWNEEIVRIRASQQKNDFPAWERERVPSIVDAVGFVMAKRGVKLKNRK
jgi:hypothetical protein